MDEDRRRSRLTTIFSFVVLIVIVCAFFVMTRTTPLLTMLSGDKEQISNIQASPRIVLTPPRRERMEIGASEVDIKLKLIVDYAREEKGPISYYDAFFSGRYKIENPGPWSELSFDFPLPKTHGTFSNIQVLVDGREPDRVEYSSEKISFSTRFPTGGTKDIVVSYKASGTGDYIYALDHIRRIRDFSLTMDLHGVEDVGFPNGCLLPTSEIKTRDGWHLSWDLKNLITKRNIGISLPPQLGYAGKFEILGWSAPLFLLLFLGCLRFSSMTDYIILDPHHYLLLGISFFLFYPLIFTLSRHLPIEWSFGIAFVIVSILILSFLRRISSMEFAIKRGLLFLLIFLLLCPLAILITKAMSLLFLLGGLILVASFMEVVLRVREVPVKEAAPFEAGLEEDLDRGLGELLTGLKKEAPKDVQKEGVERLEAFCAYCGEEVSSGYDFCPSCGKGIPRFATCKECGKELCGECATHYKYCPECGGSIKIS